MKKAIFGAGCFWGVERTFSRIKGVKDTKVGYMGGHLKNPTYEDVCTDKTGHVEVVEIRYDPKEITYEDLLEIFWNIHDPTQKNKQGLDVGTQYKSVIFYENEEQRKIAEKSKENLEKSKKFKKPIVTKISPVKKFYQAEEYHQQYFKKRQSQTK